MKKVSFLIALLLAVSSAVIVFFPGCGEAETEEVKKPTPAPLLDMPYNVYYGFLHNHSEASDGTGTPLEAYTYARDKAKLDFFSLADHETLLDKGKWETIKKAAKESARLGKFVTFHGFEWSSGKWGHVTVINSKEIFESSGKTFTDLLKWMKDRDVVAILNHPGRQDGGRCEFNHFKDTPSENVIGMELWNKSAGFRRYYYNDGYYRKDGGKSYFDEGNARGWRIGAAGSDDNHDATWGTRNDYRMGVLAKNLTEKDIYTALKARRFFSTLDKNLKLYFSCGREPMGSVLAPGTYEIEIGMSDDDSEIFSKIELSKNGEVVKTWIPNSQKPVITDTLKAEKDDFYYVVVTQKDKDQAISSPIFFRKKSVEKR